MFGTYTYATRPPVAESTFRMFPSIQARFRSAHFARGGHDLHRCASRSVRVRSHGDLDRAVDRVLERRVHAGRRIQRDAVHRQQVLTGADVHAGSVSGDRRVGFQLTPPSTLAKRYLPLAIS